MSKYLITKCLKEYIVWKKTFWGWRCLKDQMGKELYFSTAEAAEAHLVKINMLHGQYPIVKEINFSK